MKNHLILSIICLLIAFQNVVGQEKKTITILTAGKPRPSEYYSIRTPVAKK